MDSMLNCFRMSVLESIVVHNHLFGESDSIVGKPHLTEVYLHEPKAYLCCQNHNVVLSHLRGYHHRYSSFTYVLYVYSACQQLIALFPVIPVPWWPDDWCPNSRLSREWKNKSNAQYPRLHWWRAHFQKDWSWEEEPTSKAFLNILGRRGYIFKDFKVLYVFWICLSDQRPKNWIPSGVIELIVHELLTWFCLSPL